MVQHLLKNPAHFVRADVFDQRHRFSHRHHSSADHQLFRRMFHGGVGPLRGAHARHNELVLRPFQMHRINTGRLRTKQLACGRDQRTHLVGGRYRVNNKVRPGMSLGHSAQSFDVVERADHRHAHGSMHPDRAIE